MRPTPRPYRSLTLILLGTMMALTSAMFPLFPAGADTTEASLPYGVPEDAVPAPEEWGMDGIYLASPPDEACQDTGSA